MKSKTRLMSKFMVIMLAFAVMFAYSVMPMSQAYAASKKPTKITLNAASKNLVEGQTFKLKVKSISPKKASSAVVWKSSNTKVATVSSKGVVKAKKAGNAVITATSKSNKKVKAKVKVAVNDKTVFVNASYVNKTRKKANTVVAEVSWGPDEYAPTKRIPNAIHINTDMIESNAPDLGYELWDIRDSENGYKKIISYLKSMGITTDTHLIVYGANGTDSGCTRFAFTALMMGVSDVKVLDGGFEAWEKAGYATSEKIAAPKKAKSFGRKTAAHPEWIISTADAVKKVKKDKNFKLVSIRSYDEFIGKNSGYAYIDKAGEPKGAIWGRDTDDGSYFKKGKTVGVKTLNKYLKDYKASTKNELAFYCGTGWRATIPFLICYQAGVKDMKLWDDGWYVYSGAFADEWNWVDGKPSKAVKDYPVQIGDPKTGKVTYTTVSKLEPKYTALRKLEAKKADMNANAGTYSVFNIMPPKPAIGKAITFKSSDESVATVDENGLVTVKDAVGKEVTITAESIATKGSTRSKAGSPVATATVKIKTVGAFDSNMDAEVWKSFGIEYKDVDPENDFILDVRKSSPNFAEGHIKGAVNVDVTAGAIADGDAVAQALEKAYTDAKGKRIVVVCNSGQTLAKRAMEYYRTHGKDMGTITYLIGGNGAVPAADLVK